MVHSSPTPDVTARHHKESSLHDSANAAISREARLKSTCVTSVNFHHPGPRSPGFQLMRKQALLKKIPFSNSTLHAKLDPKSPYYDGSVPTPIYLPGSRIPYWDAAAIDAWVEALIWKAKQ
jgi:predicted DNA-binding transcriptional regulator AlpA